MNGSPNPELIRENILKLISHQVECLDVLFPVYNQNKGGFLKTPSLLSTKDLLRWSNKNH